MKEKQAVSPKSRLSLVAVIPVVLGVACAKQDVKEQERARTEAREAERLRAEDREAARKQQELVKRGKYLVDAGACHDCHSPKIMTEHGPVPDPARLLAGHPADAKLPATSSVSPEWVAFSMDLTAAVGPWGVSYSANLTPDETGLGGWTFERFQTAIRKGKYRGIEGGRDLLPPMPWQMISNYTDQDLRAIFAYLQSIPPVKNLVPAPHPRERHAEHSTLEKSGRDG